MFMVLIQSAYFFSPIPQNSMTRTIPLPASTPIANHNRRPPAIKIPSHTIASFSAGIKTSSSQSSTCTMTTSSAANLYSSSVSVVPSISLLRHRPSPDLGLASVLFVLSTVLGALVSLGLISIPAIAALRRLERSGRRLENVAAREVPGTLLSLKLSSMEIGRVAQILSSIRRGFDRSRV